MLKEEKKLRGWVGCIEFAEYNKRDFYRDIRNLARAVREDCAKVAENTFEPTEYGSFWSKIIAAAIRGKK